MVTASPYRPLRIPYLYPILDMSGLLPCPLVSVVLLLLLVLPVWFPKPSLGPLTASARMSPTLYTAKNNGEGNNGGNTTMVITTTMANNRIGHRDIWSVFPSFRYGVNRTEI